MSPEFNFVIKADLGPRAAGDLLTKITETEGIISVNVQLSADVSIVEVDSPVLDGETIRSARLARGLKQTDLGNMVGLSKSTISNIENNRVGSIRAIRTRNRVAEALGLRAEESSATRDLADLDNQPESS